ncbi:hypothetical protein LPB136_12205 [Tenacibaculum todarodis]|uniref:Uncharacterized protein n=1 Tax=Tenacibaculum todarodis TaxID=1850252 RepID=A0A1L3JLQ3_9FLAO|nr:hypothetical protein [Tenacibaculum todarodis]APG66085.1 hypothetical protein LPB136_12205 [Tenacibaculum todarodis]
MAKKQDQNASFMVRFNQQIYKENGDAKVQWRGKISHVQDGDEKRFSDFNDALVFMQEKLALLTNEATKDEPKEERESILQKSFSMFKTVRDVAPQFLKETIKNPKKQFSNIQEQIQDQIENLGEEISEKVQFDQWKKASRADYHELQTSIDSLSKEIKKLNSKVDKISKK